MVVTTDTEVKNVARLTNEFTTTEINTEIDIVTAELYSKYNLPKRSSFILDDEYTRFYISKEPVYDIIRIRAQVDTTIDPSGYTIITATGSWSFIDGTNYIDVTQNFINAYDTKIIRIDYIPKIHNLIATNMAALNLIEETTITDGDEISTPQATKIKDRIQRYKDTLKPKTFIRSSVNDVYDPYEYISINQTDFR